MLTGQSHYLGAGFADTYGYDGLLAALVCRDRPGWLLPVSFVFAVIRTGGGFLLVPPGDIERLSQRIDELLSDRERLREAGRRARATVAAHFTWERCGEQTRAAYEEALRDGRGR